MRFTPDCLRLYLVTDRPMLRGKSLAELVHEAVAGGVTAVQLREKEATGDEFYRLALQVKDVLAGTGVPLIINDRVDVALAAGADGVHLGQRDLPLVAARRLVGDRMFIGLSVNTVEEVQQAQAGGADYLGAGPAYATATKLDTDPELGPEGLRHLAAATPLPVVAIGGIHAATLPSLCGIGLAGVAVVSAICAAADPRRAAANLLKVLGV
ncbi:MAG: thiamine phosphate synthase [Acidobacteria bacterium]|nr:thiamine phosphate synthase [Acidobacteriota bacterium]